jgi:hypothetical protein
VGAGSRSQTRAASKLALDEDAQRWPVSRERLEASGAFRRTRELVLHNVEWGDGDRLLGFALSEGSMTTLLEAGVTEEEVGLDHLRVAEAKMREPYPGESATALGSGKGNRVDDDLDRAD